jgi:putative hydrolase of the HAD superfamily
MDTGTESFQPRLIEAVSFDINGTLIHSPRLGTIYSEVLSRHGLEVEADRLEAAVHLVWAEFDCAARPGADRFSSNHGGARDFWSRFADRVCIHLDLGRPSRFAKAELFERFCQAEAWEIFDEVVAVLNRLDEAGVRLAVLSNWDERLPKLLTNLGLIGYFESVVFSSQVGVEKPFPEIFSCLLDSLDLPPEAVLHVGDREREDIEGAIGVGMQAVRICRDGQGAGMTELTELLETVIGSKPTGRG